MLIKHHSVGYIEISDNRITQEARLYPAQNPAMRPEQLF